ncbi:ClbS/DfsB family four-helix bundle protein [Paenibacillus sp. AN1007]|uniref:ClbS/DfsB family four-helix bundle protein n=1 Tax=Paenibacillus sp. AN1007 TaxID=3151385 RepID=A0AAU8NHY1_9BACL
MSSRETRCSIRREQPDGSSLFGISKRKRYKTIFPRGAIRKLELSHERVMSLIQQHTQEEIMAKKHYKWVKTSNLYSYFAANTADHYIWALKKCAQMAKQL